MKHLIIPDCHSHPDFNNDRADLLSKLIQDVKPDKVINIGDQWDFPSLSSYDKGRRSFQGRSYASDVAAGLEFSDRVWGPLRRRKKKLPERFFFVGNHEQRIDRALDLSPELENTITYDDLDLERDYDHIVKYTGNTPGLLDIDGITYGHYFISGVMGRPIGGEHPATSLLAKQHTSCVVGHIHTADFSVRSRPDGRKLMAVVAGCFVDYDVPWAGEIQKLWWRGAVVLHNVDDGMFDPEFISLERLQNEYA